MVKTINKKAAALVHTFDIADASFMAGSEAEIIQPHAVSTTRYH